MRGSDSGIGLDWIGYILVPFKAESRLELHVKTSFIYKPITPMDGVIRYKFSLDCQKYKSVQAEQLKNFHFPVKEQTRKVFVMFALESAKASVLGCCAGAEC